MPMSKFPKRRPLNPDRSALIKLLIVRTGLSQEGIRKILINKGRPENVIIAEIWDRTVDAYEKRLAEARSTK